MTTTTTDDSTLATLQRAILLNPLDDLARLVYADRLEELAGTVQCENCDGEVLATDIDTGEVCA
jgi:uncharacterized protein (TIGR02996 family)